MNTFRRVWTRTALVNEAGYSAAEVAVGSLLRRGIDVPASDGRCGGAWTCALHAFGLVVRRLPSSRNETRVRGHFTVPTARTYPAIEAFIAAGISTKEIA